MPLKPMRHGWCAGAAPLTVQVWDGGLVKAVEKAFVMPGLGLNRSPMAVVRVPVPELSAERRT